MSYFGHLAIFMCIYITLAVSLNISLGFTGLFNLGHIAFFAIGAYLSALFTIAGMPFWLAFILAATIAGLSSLLISLPSLRLRGDYFAIATFGFAEIIKAIIKNWYSVTKGPLGIGGIPKPNIFGLTANTQFEILILYIIITVAIIFIINKIINSPFGRTLRAIREDEIAAKALGKNTTQFKVTAVLIGSFFAGIAGSMYAHYITYIGPSISGLSELIFILSIVILGGLGSIKGSILGTIVIVLLPEPLRLLNLPIPILAASRKLIYSLILVIIVMFKPEGLIPEKNFKVKNASNK